jgi:hypothetical protein
MKLCRIYIYNIILSKYSIGKRVHIYIYEIYLTDYDSDYNMNKNKSPIYFYLN